MEGLIPASNEPSDCREGHIPRPLGRFKFDAPLLAAGFLTWIPSMADNDQIMLTDVREVRKT